MDSTDSLVVQCDTRMRWAQLKQRLCAQGSRRGSSKSSRQIGQVSSDSSVSIFRQSSPGSSAKSKEADQLSGNRMEDLIRREGVSHGELSALNASQNHSKHRSWEGKCMYLPNYSLSIPWGKEEGTTLSQHTSKHSLKVPVTESGVWSCVAFFFRFANFFFFKVLFQTGKLLNL